MDRLHVKYNTALTLYFYIYNTATYSGGEPVTGLSPSCYYRIDAGGSSVSTGTTVSELDGSSLPGIYKVACTDVVTDGDVVIMNLYYASGSRSNPVTLYTDKTEAGLIKTAPTTTHIAENTAINTIVAANTTQLTTIDGIVDAILVDTGTTLDGKLDTIDNFLDTEIAAILTDTGTTLAANHSAIETIVAANAAQLVIIDNFLDTEIAAILVDTSTTLNDKIDVIDGIVDSILVDTAVLGATPIAANVTQVGGSADAATNLNTSANAMKIGLVHNSTAPTASSFLSDSGTLSSQNDAYNNRLLIMTSGTLVGAVAEIADYVGSTKTFTFTSPLPAAPGNNDTFIIV